jgi:hypothetical protein
MDRQLFLVWQRLADINGQRSRNYVHRAERSSKSGYCDSDCDLCYRYHQDGLSHYHYQCSATHLRGSESHPSNVTRCGLNHKPYCRREQ